MEEIGKQKRITVMTPSYNRADLLSRLYQSLRSQSFFNFEWLIIDDGSLDGTGQIVEQWMAQERSFPIRYCFQQNGGKARAVNHGLELAEGEIFLVVDSDDVLTKQALEKINDWFYEIEDVPGVKGIVANKGTIDGVPMNPLFKEAYLDRSLLDMGTYCEDGKRVLGGERLMAFYTAFHRQYRYPVFPDEKFMTEAVVYNRMAHDGFRMRFFNDVLCCCEYQPDGLSASGSNIYLNNPRGYGLWFRERAEFLGVSLVIKWKMYYSFYCDLRLNRTNREIAEYIGTTPFVIGICSFAFRMKRAIKL